MMAMVMRNADWMQTIDNVRNSDRVWFENIATHSGSIPLDVPEAGYYQVLLIKIDSKPEISEVKRPDARKFLGYGERFHKLRTTEDWMKELREGEKE